MATALYHCLDQNVPIGPLVKAIEERPYLWKQITARQKAKGSAHHSTEAIFLRWCEGRTEFDAFNDLIAIDYPASAVLWAALSPVLSHVYGVVPHHEVGRIMVANLKAGCDIDRHSDEGLYANHYERFHVALQSHEGNAFHVGGVLVKTEEGNLHRIGGVSFYPKRGELYWFNHKQKHSVENRSTHDRWHLIIDLVPKHSYLKASS